MSDKERVINLLEYVPSHKLGYVIAYLQGLTADELEDDAYCCRLIDEYKKDPDKGECISFDEMAAKCGLKLNEL